MLIPQESYNLGSQFVVSFIGVPFIESVGAASGVSYYLSLDGRKWGLAVARRRRSTRRRSGLQVERIRISNVAVPPAPATVNAAAVIQTAVVI